MYEQDNQSHHNPNKLNNMGHMSNSMNNEASTIVKNINNKCLCFGLRKGSRAITQYFDYFLEKEGLRSTQFTLLVELSNSKSTTLTEIANNLVMDRTTLTRNLKPLEKNGWIQGEKNADRRSKSYSLTEKGQSLLSRAVPQWQHAQDSLEKALSNEKVNNILKDVYFVTQNIPKIPVPPKK